MACMATHQEAAEPGPDMSPADEHLGLDISGRGAGPPPGLPPVTRC